MGGTQSFAVPVKGIYIPSEKDPDPVLAYADRVITILNEEYPMVREYIRPVDILDMAKALMDGVPEEEIRAYLAEMAKMCKEAFVRTAMPKTPYIPILR